MILDPVDSSGIYSLPEGKTAADIVSVYVDGAKVAYIPVKDGTEIDVPEAGPNAVVDAVFK